jgi:hypothetical protein
MIFGFLFLVAAVVLFLTYLPKAVKDCGMRAVRLKRSKPSAPVKCNH